MTLEQSDFQRLTEVLVGLIERYKENPAVVEAVLTEFYDMYRKIPIYPSIVCECLEKVVKEEKPEELQAGQEVIIVTKDGRSIAGRVAEVSGGEVKLSEVREVILTPPSGEISVERDSIKEVKRVNREILSGEWPTLDFEEEQE